MHIIITPVFNEAQYLNSFIKSIISQTLPPSTFCLVDDNSTDSSAEIIKSYSSKYPWIKYVFHASGEYKAQGGKIVNAFNYGLSKLDISSASFLSKIDADLELPNDYFEKISQVFSNNQNIGICGGKIIENTNGQWVKTIQGDYFVRGALKSYRLECFKEIGGLKPVLGWDGLDIMMALNKNWETCVLPIDVKHFRIASSDYDVSELNLRLGKANYQNGSNLFLALIRSTVKIWRQRSLMVGCSFLKGYLKARKEKVPMNVDDNLKRFINNFHIKRIFSLSRIIKKLNK
jgi:glycosyltransferase involved in cell wall biosynthesis